MGPSILTVTVNPAIDRTYTVPGFSLNTVHRSNAAVSTIGGKGINVARVYRTLGGDARTTGFIGGSTGELIRRGLNAEGIPNDFIGIGGESRICLKIMDPLAGTQTEINETGPVVLDADCDALCERLRELLPGCAYLVLSGSLPPGAPVDLYARAIRLAQDELGIAAVLDASGAALEHGIAASPYLVKPNVFELGALGIDPEPIEVAAQQLRDRYGVAVALVTAGARGAAVSSTDTVWSAKAPEIDVKSAVGSGDALIAGFLWSLGNRADLPSALALGIGAGAANGMSYGAGFCKREEILDLASRTVVNLFA